MKSFTSLILSLLTIGLLSMAFVSCDKEESGGGAELSALSYATGEVALGNTNYVSAAPSIFTTSAATFSITKVTQNSKVIDNTSPNVMAIDAKTGIITASIKDEDSYVGEYFVSVRVKNSSASADYDKIFRLVVKGIKFENAANQRGTAFEVKPVGIYIAQGSGTEYSLALPQGSTAADYAGITVDPKTCVIAVSAETHAGIYPISITVKNSTNASTTLANVAEISILSKPYGLSYTTSGETLITKEGHTSALPKIYAASKDEGNKVTYELLDRHGDQFSIDQKTGVISLPEDNELPGELKTYQLSVIATNSEGSETFSNVYSITIDPLKTIEAISAVTYSDTFPVELKPGQPWTSSAPQTIGSKVGINFSLVAAPEGVTIDAKTGVITLAAGHKMPLTLTDNNLNVSVKNSSPAAGFEISVGTFAINPVLWAVQFTTNTANDALNNSGIGNMDRYSFLGRMLQPKATSIQIKNGWAISSDKKINGLNCSATEATTGNTLQWNNDWLVSSEIAVAAYAFNPAVLFNFAAQYGSGAQFFNMYILEMNSTNVYTKGDQNQDGTTLDLTKQPSNLDWGVPVWSSIIAEGGLIQEPTLKKNIPLSAYKGKTIRIAFQFYNSIATTNNTRSYSLDQLRVEDSLVP